MPALICVARIGAAHGVRGAVKLWTFTEDPLAVQSYGPLMTKDGARRFVFEGAECGGHVGPRNSFALWEAQCAVIAGALDAGAKGEEFAVLFAGGRRPRGAGTGAVPAGGVTSAGGGSGSAYDGMGTTDPSSLLSTVGAARWRGSRRGFPRASPSALRSSIRSTSSACRRARGSLRSRPVMTGLSGPALTGSGGFSVASAVSEAIAVGRAYGEAPSTAANSVAPSDQRSASGEDVPCLARSGATYSGNCTSQQRSHT